MVRRSTRPHNQSTWLKDFIMSTKATATPNPEIHYAMLAPVRHKFQAFLSAITNTIDPISFSEAAQDGRWCASMNEELEALERNHTWAITTLPEGKKAIGCKWLYRTKYNSNGTINKYKARLVIQGCR